MIMMVLVLTEEEETKLRGKSEILYRYSGSMTSLGLGIDPDHKIVNKQEIKHCHNR